MILPYVYKLTYRKTGEFYIGYRAANKVPSHLDIGIKYFSSSKKVKEIGFENFDISIVAEFFDAQDAFEFEQGLIKENFKDPLCLNRHYENNGMQVFNNVGVKFPPEYGQRISKQKTGYRFSEEKKAEMRMARDRKGAKNSFYGKKHTQECIDKMAQKMRTFSVEEEMKIIIVYSSGLTITQIHSIYKDRCSKKPIQNIINRYKNNLLKEKGL